VLILGGGDSPRKRFLPSKKVAPWNSRGGGGISLRRKAAQRKEGCSSHHREGKFLHEGGGEVFGGVKIPILASHGNWVKGIPFFSRKEKGRRELSQGRVVAGEEEKTTTTYY